MKTIEVSESALESLKAMAQKLQQERDMLLVALQDCVKSRDKNCFDIEKYTETSEFGSYWSPSKSMIDSEVISKARAAIAACQESTKVLES